MEIRKQKMKCQKISFNREEQSAWWKNRTSFIHRPQGDPIDRSNLITCFLASFGFLERYLTLTWSFQDDFLMWLGYSGGDCQLLVSVTEHPGRARKDVISHINAETGFSAPEGNLFDLSVADKHRCLFSVGMPLNTVTLHGQQHQQHTNYHSLLLSTSHSTATKVFLREFSLKWDHCCCTADD